MHCVYCELPEIHQRTILRNDLAWAFPTNIPIVLGHVLIAPIRCVEDYAALTKEEYFAIRDIIFSLRKALQKAFHAEGFNYAWNEGEVAGQNVPHFHLHMLPRKKGDTGVDPRQYFYRPGSRETTPEAKLQQVASIIRKFL